jgi:hypothetical protein
VWGIVDLSAPSSSADAVSASLRIGPAALRIEGTW